MKKKIDLSDYDYFDKEYGDECSGCRKSDVPTVDVASFGGGYKIGDKQDDWGSSAFFCSRCLRKLEVWP